MPGLSVLLWFLNCTCWCLYVFPWCSGSLAKGGFVIKPSETRCAELPFHWDALMLQQPSFQIPWVSAGLIMPDTGDTLSYFSGYKTAKQSVRIQWNMAIVSSDCWKNACRGRAFLMLQFLNVLFSYILHTTCYMLRATTEVKHAPAMVKCLWVLL